MKQKKNWGTTRHLKIHLSSSTKKKEIDIIFLMLFKFLLHWKVVAKVLLYYINELYWYSQCTIFNDNVTNVTPPKQTLQHCCCCKASVDWFLQSFWSFSYYRLHLCVDIPVASILIIINFNFNIHFLLIYLFYSIMFVSEVLNLLREKSKGLRY